MKHICLNVNKLAEVIGGLSETPNDKYSFMIERPHWIARLRAAWQKRPVVWLVSVRRGLPENAPGMEDRRTQEPDCVCDKAAPQPDATLLTSRPPTGILLTGKPP